MGLDEERMFCKETPPETTMSKVMKFARSSCLWLLLAGWGFFGLGAASNQAVLIANGDKFPVLVNPVKLAEFLPDGVALLPPGQSQMVDTVHETMTKDTHLNALADIFDMHSSIYSVGDGLLLLGEWLNTWCPFAWFFLICKKIYDEGEQK